MDRLFLSDACRRLSRHILIFLAWLPLAAVSPVQSQDDLATDAYYIADIELQTPDDLRQLLDRAEQFVASGASADDPPRLTLVLHGPVLRTLMRQNYQENAALVRQAASLSALQVIDVKACRSWMTSKRLDPTQLQPFVEVVSYGPGEVQRLVKEEGYLYF